MKKYILFDNDGVLVETEPWYYEASKKALKEFFNINIQFEEYMDIMTKGGGVWEIVQDATSTQINTARDKRNLYYQDYLKTKEIAIPNVHKILHELSKNYKMAIITTSRRVDFEIIHNQRGIVEFMDFVLCEGEYPKAKPHPDPYLKGMEQFNSNITNTIVVEDSQRGLISAHQAGIDCIVVHNEFTKTQDFSLATHKINKLEDLLTLL